MESSSVSVFILQILQLTLCLFFFSSGLGKLFHLKEFSQSVTNFQILPQRIAGLFSLVLPWIELSTSVALLFGIFIRLSAFIISLLLIIFLVAIIINLRRNRNIECACYGIAGTKLISQATTVRNSLLLILSILVVILAPDQPTFSMSIPLVSVPVEELIITFLLVAFCLVTVSLIEWLVYVNTLEYQRKAALAAEPQSQLIPTHSIQSMN